MWRSLSSQAPSSRSGSSVRLVRHLAFLRMTIQPTAHLPDVRSNNTSSRHVEMRLRIHGRRALAAVLSASADHFRRWFAVTGVARPRRCADESHGAGPARGHEARSRARWLTTTQVAALCFAGLTPEMARRRIRLLREARYIRSVQSNGMAEALHTLGPRGGNS